MGWVKKIPYVEPHVCPVPRIVDGWGTIVGRRGSIVSRRGKNPTVGAGSLWRCDECGQTWEVSEVTRNGLYYWWEHEPKRRLRG